MNKTEYLLACLTEENGEVIQEVCKAIRFGLSDVNPKEPEKGDNQRRIEREMAEALAVFNLLGFEIREEDMTSKIQRLNEMMKYSRKVGTLE